MSDTIQTMDLDGACAFLHVRPSTLYQWCSERRLKYHKAGGKSLFYLHELVEFLDAQTAAALGRPRRSRKARA